MSTRGFGDNRSSCMGGASIGPGSKTAGGTGGGGIGFVMGGSGSDKSEFKDGDNEKTGDAPSTCIIELPSAPSETSSGAGGGPGPYFSLNACTLRCIHSFLIFGGI